MVKTFLIIWAVILMDGNPISSLRVQIPQDNMDVCQESLQNQTSIFIIDNEEYWDGYDLMVTSECIWNTQLDNKMDQSE